MAKYYSNKNAQSNGDHEVHKDDCAWMPKPENRKDLGNFTNCKDAVNEAKKTDPTADGCKHCSPDCHKG